MHIFYFITSLNACICEETLSKLGKVSIIDYIPKITIIGKKRAENGVGVLIYDDKKLQIEEIWEWVMPTSCKFSATYWRRGGWVFNPIPPRGGGQKCPL